MRILLLGKNGQVGWELQRSLAPLGEVLALDSRAENFCGDLRHSAGLRATLAAYQPQVVVNAAAYTAVDKAETEREVAEQINHDAVRALAEGCKELGALLVHYSTDYVFDGSGNAPRAEDAATAPLNVYGASKLRGEQAIQAVGCPHLIFRTSWVYATRGANFLKTMLRLAQERESLSVVADQWGAPTGAELIADVTAHALRKTLQEPQLGGLYHLSAGGCTNWHEYATLVIETARQLGAPVKIPSAEAITPISAAQFPTPAKRPANSRMSVDKLQTALDLQMPPWQNGVVRVVHELL